MTFSDVCALVDTIRCRVFGTGINLIVARDQKAPDPASARIYIQPEYQDTCCITGEPRTYRGRKWYLSAHMTDDEVVKTCFAAFKACVEHEVLEGFTFDGERVFNPHADFRALMEAGRHQVFRS